MYMEIPHVLFYSLSLQLPLSFSDKLKFDFSIPESESDYKRRQEFFIVNWPLNSHSAGPGFMGQEMGCFYWCLSPSRERLLAPGCIPFDAGSPPLLFIPNKFTKVKASSSLLDVLFYNDHFVLMVMPKRLYCSSQLKPFIAGELTISQPYFYPQCIHWLIIYEGDSNGWSDILITGINIVPDTDK